MSVENQFQGLSIFCRIFFSISSQSYLLFTELWKKCTAFCAFPCGKVLAPNVGTQWLLKIVPLFRGISVEKQLHKHSVRACLGAESKSGKQVTWRATDFLWGKKNPFPAGLIGTCPNLLLLGGGWFGSGLIWFMEGMGLWALTRVEFRGGFGCWACLTCPTLACLSLYILIS